MSNDEENYDIVCIWEVKNFNPNCVGVELWSPVFVLNSLDDSEWRIALCVDNYENNSSYFFNFRLKCVSDVPRDKIDCELSIMDSNKSPLKKTQARNCDFKTICYYSLESLKIEEDIFGLNERKFFPNGSLTIRCRMQKNSSKSRNKKPEMHSSCICIERSCFLWTIENFCQLQPFQKSKIHLVQSDSSSMVVSFDFFFDDYERFQIKVACNGCSPPIDASFKISLLDANMQLRKTEDFSLCNSCTSLSLKRRELVDNKTLYLPMGILSLQVACFFTIEENLEGNTEQFSYQNLYAIRDTTKDSITSPSETEDGSVIGDDKCHSSSHREFFQNLLHLYEEDLFSDGCLLVDGESLAIHRSILSARFPAFKTLFIETQDEECPSMGLDTCTLSTLLHFAYSDRLPAELNWLDAVRLHFEADKRSMTHVKNATRSFLKVRLDTSHAIDTLHVADMTGDEDLKSATVDFILSHHDEVIGCREWEVFQKSHVQLAVEVLGELYKRKMQKNSM